MCGILKNNYLNKKTNAQQQFGKMAGLVLNSTAVLRLNFCAKLNICASVSATSPSCKTLVDTLLNILQKTIRIFIDEILQFINSVFHKFSKI